MSYSSRKWWSSVTRSTTTSRTMDSSKWTLLETMSNSQKSHRQSLVARALLGAEDAPEEVTRAALEAGVTIQARGVYVGDTVLMAGSVDQPILAIATIPVRPRATKVTDLCQGSTATLTTIVGLGTLMSFQTTWRKEWWPNRGLQRAWTTKVWAVRDWVTREDCRKQFTIGIRSSPPLTLEWRVEGTVWTRIDLQEEDTEDALEVTVDLCPVVEAITDPNQIWNWFPGGSITATKIDRTLQRNLLCRQRRESEVISLLVPGQVGHWNCSSGRFKLSKHGGIPPI